VVLNHHLVVEPFLETMELWHMKPIYEPKNQKRAGDLMRADGRLEMNMCILRTFHSYQFRYGLLLNEKQFHVNLMSASQNNGHEPK
jgi:hypothetical protein